LQHILKRNFIQAKHGGFYRKLELELKTEATDGEVPRLNQRNSNIFDWNLNDDYRQPLDHGCHRQRANWTVLASFKKDAGELLKTADQRSFSRTNDTHKLDHRPDWSFTQQK